MRITLLSDQPILADCLAVVLGEAGLTLEPAAASMTALLAYAEPDIVLVDATADFTLDIVSQIRAAWPEAKIILWVRNIASELAYQAMGIGVRGVLRKTLPTTMLAKCLYAVYDGELWFDKALTEDFFLAKRISLTAREGQLVTCLTHGLKNKEIAFLLAITEGTVKVYLSRLFVKCGVKDRFELALYGLKNTTADNTTVPLGSDVPSLRALILGQRAA